MASTFELYLKTTGLNSKLEERQIAVLLHVIDNETLEYSTFELNIEQKIVPDEVITAFDNFCTQKTNESVD